ncbi:HD domain-containing protein [Methylobacterium currus]|uniref:5'-deoxynucleotidase n=1 Tax=Methylobacterium currus TaxID=2051553 RepID=A0A2R4WJE6_9HYPH|nr:HD domain-containing protein [Methylobacterium currus]AWB21668.1 HD domain-containing protein [Methylobacterium currus]UHC18712.1 HD domain-containing protein [Methylobacterium currus]
MTPDDLAGTLDFLQRAEALKSTLRSGYAASGRQESTAEHTWRLCLMVMVLADGVEGIDALKLFKMCLVHDLGEAVGGDIPATDPRAADKTAQERRDLQALTAPLPPTRRDEILSLWEEYEAGTSPEAILAKGFDKLETILQHNQGRNPPGFDYAFNLVYGAKHTARHPLTAAIRAVLDEGTRARMADRVD